MQCSIIPDNKVYPKKGRSINKNAMERTQRRQDMMLFCVLCSQNEFVLPSLVETHSDAFNQSINQSWVHSFECTWRICLNWGCVIFHFPFVVIRPWSFPIGMQPKKRFLFFPTFEQLPNQIRNRVRESWILPPASCPLLLPSTSLVTILGLSLPPYLFKHSLSCPIHHTPCGCVSVDLRPFFWGDS